MAMGKRSGEGVQGELFITSGDVPGSPGHAFYDRLNAVLAEAKFDGFVESRCRPYYDDPSKGGRPSVPPGNYFRMLFVGYFEGIDSQRGIAWRCADSLSLRAFLGLAWHESSPDHSSLTKIRQRLPESVHEAVFGWVLKLCAEKKLLTDPSVVGVDSTTIEANAAMRSIVRKDTKQTYHEYVKGLMKDEAAAANPPEKTDPPKSPPPPPASPTTNSPVQSEANPRVSPNESGPGKPEPTLAEIIRFDRTRKGKTCSNADWHSPADPDARIAKMKDGRTHLAYKAEHVVDLKSEVILAAELYPADRSDYQTGVDSVLTARCRLTQAGLTDLAIDGCAQDKGYHAREPLALAETYSLRTDVAEPDRPHRAKWKDVPDEQRKAVYANRRRVKGERGKALQRRRSEVVERSFAHVCETGGSRRSWLRGLAKIRKRYAMAIAARNLGLLMRKMFGIGKPRTLQTGGPADGYGGRRGPGSTGPDGLLKRLLGQLRSRFDLFGLGPNRIRFLLAAT